MPRASLRHHGAAFLAATVAALVGNAALQLALDAVAVRQYGGGAPWWVTTEVIDRGRWVVFAGLLWLVVPHLLRGKSETAPAAQDEPADAWRRVSTLVWTLPLLWVAATWLISAARFTALASWDTEGLAFVSPDYYRALLLDYAPWLIGGAVVRVGGRHV
jgi:hypothetical protein